MQVWYEVLQLLMNTTLKRTGLKVDQKNPRWCKILVNRELHSDQSDRSCRHIEIDIEGGLISNSLPLRSIPSLSACSAGVKALNYSPGDHLGVYPQNESSVIAAVAKRLNVRLPFLSQNIR